jgi:hypothetical protein
MKHNQLTWYPRRLGAAHRSVHRGRLAAVISLPKDVQAAMVISRLPSRMTRVVFLALSAMHVLVQVQPAGAYIIGITGYSGKGQVICNVCHSGGTAPIVSFSGPTTLTPRDTGDFTFTLQATSDLQLAAGLNIAASAGTLRVVTQQKVQKEGDELTHTAPKLTDDQGVVTWRFRWQAPNVAGNYILYGAGNSINDNGAPSGDQASATVFFIAVGDVTPLPTFTPTGGASATPTASPTATSLPPTATASPTQTATPTVTVTASPTLTATLTVTATDTPPPTATATPPMTATYTDTPTFKATEPLSATASPTSPSTETATAALSPSPTLVVRGDANCDQELSAADIPGVIAQLPGADAGLCGADADGSGTVTGSDVTEVVDRLFGS